MKRQTDFIITDKNLPFTPESNQVIYVESRYNTDSNKYIIDNYEMLCILFQKMRYNFIYIPKIIENLNYETISYFYPFLNYEDIINQANAQTIIEKLLSYREEKTFLSGGLLRFKYASHNRFIFDYYQFTNFEETEISEQFRDYIYYYLNESASKSSGYRGGYFDLREPPRYSYPRQPNYSLIAPEIEPNNDYADQEFSFQAWQLIEEIRIRVEALKQTGVNEMVLKSLFPFSEEAKLSRLVITTDYRILLPDYKREITMHPLPKAVFFLFLKHPDGILFKYLSVYRKELLEIYKKIATKGYITDFERSIDDLVDPSKNAINEKCARIREAFIKEFDESIAKNYFITGGRATPKKIVLDRKLVVLEGII